MVEDSCHNIMNAEATTYYELNTNNMRTTMAGNYSRSSGGISRISRCPHSSMVLFISLLSTMTMTSLFSTTTTTSAYQCCFTLPPPTTTKRHSFHPGRLASLLPATPSFRPRRHISPLALRAMNKDESDAEQQHDDLNGSGAENNNEEVEINDINSINEVDDNDEDEDTNNIHYHLSKISWLPNVKLGKQPYESTTASAVSSSMHSRTEEGGDNYRTVTSRNSKKNRNVEVLPVLPMTMVCGLGGDLLSVDSDDANDDEEDIDTDLFGRRRRNRNSNSDETAILGFRSDDDDLHPQQILGPPFSSGGTSSYLPHTKNHVLTISEPRYKHMYDDLLRLGKYAGARREGMIRREMEEVERKKRVGGSSSNSNMSSSTSSYPNPDEKRRFIVTAANPIEDGVFAEYGLLFQLKDLDEVSAVGGVGGGSGEDGGLTMEELEDLVGSYRDDEEGYGFVDIGDEDDEEDVMDILLRTHYEATHDVVGRVRIHRFVNPECFTEDPPGGEEYLMAEATILDVVDEGKGGGEIDLMREQKLRAAASRGTEGKAQQTTTTSTTAATPSTNALSLEGDLAKAVARIKEELRSSVGEAYSEQQQLLQSDNVKDKLRAALDEAPAIKKTSSSDSSSSSSSSLPSATNNRKGSGHITTNTSPRKAGGGSSGGVYVEKLHEDSLTKEERQLRESFAKLVTLQHELKEECRFTRVSVQTFGVGPVGVWLSAAAWSQFVEKRLEATYDDMQSDLQSKLVEYLAGRDEDLGHNEVADISNDDNSGLEEAETIDFEDLSPQLQQEFQIVQARATEELGPLALDRAIQMQRIVQAQSYVERLDLLRECVDNERRRLEAKKMLKLLALKIKKEGGNSILHPGARREAARSIFERLISSTDVNRDQAEEQDNGSFQ